MKVILLQKVANLGASATKWSSNRASAATT